MIAAANDPAGVAFLRRATLQRATRSYVEWIGASVGWWTILYLVFWLVVFVIAGIQLLARLDEPLPFAVDAYVGAAVTIAFALVIYGAKAPPVFLNRRDVYRLSLAPVAPLGPLRWPFTRAWLVRGAAGLLLGTVWAVVAPFWVHHQAWFAGPALALIMIAHLNLTWLRYTQRGNTVSDPRRMFLLPLAAFWALVGMFLPPLGLTAAFAFAGPWVLVAPLVLALGSAWLVHGTLQREYPPRFAAQCFVLGELQAMRAMNLMAQMAGAPGSDDPAYRRRLLDTLHDRPGATRPRRSVRPPPLSAAPWRALNWRTRTMLVRRPWFSQLRVVFTLLLVAVAAVGVFGGGAGPFGLLLLAAVVGHFASFTLGQGGLSSTLPIEGTQRTLGRALQPALLLAAAVTAAVLVAPVFNVIAGPDALLLVASLVLLVVVLLEKYTTWTNAPATRMEAWGMSALLASAPALVLGGLDFGAFIVPVQLVALALLLLLSN